MNHIGMIILRAMNHIGMFTLREREREKKREYQKEQERKGARMIPRSQAYP